MADVDTIKAALEAIADQAPHADRVRARLEARQHGHRSRRALLVGAGALGTAVAVGVPLATVKHRSAPPVPSATPKPTPSKTPTATLSGPPVATMSFLYAPTWLPEGLVEAYRQVVSDDGRPHASTRIWMPHGKTIDGLPKVTPNVQLLVNSVVDWGPFDETVRIGSVTGHISNMPSGTTVQWTPHGGPKLVLMTDNTPDYKATLVRIAQSVRKTSLAMSYQMRLPWIPARYRGRNHVSASVRPTTDGGWVVGLDESPSYNGGGIGVSVSNRPRLTPGDLSWQLKRDDGTYAYTSKQLGDKHPIAEADAMRMMREFEFAPPDMSWVLP